MQQRYLRPLLFVVMLAGLGSCKKDPIKSIDYNALTEERILGISELNAISNEDITALENLVNERITDNSVKARLTEMLNSVKLLQAILPKMELLRTDPDINFPEKYEEIHGLVTEMSDEIPRKKVLLDELEANREGYDNSEVRFTGDFEYYLREYFKIEPIPGKNYVAYLRSDIDRVDSLIVNAVAYADLMKFNALKIIRLQSPNGSGISGENFNLNKFSQLEVLNIILNDGVKLTIDSCHNLQELDVTGKDALQRLDLAGVSESLKILKLNDVLNLKTLISPERTSLEEVWLTSGGYTPKPDSIILGGNGSTVFIGAIASKEMKALKLSGMENIQISGGAVVDETADPLVQQTIRINEFDISNNPGLKGLIISQLNLPGGLDLAPFPELKGLFFSQLAINAQDPLHMEYPASELSGFTGLEKLESITFSGIVWPENTTLDLRKARNLLWVELTSEGPELKKIILHKDVQQNQSEYGDPFYLYPEDVEVEYVD